MTTIKEQLIDLLSGDCYTLDQIQECLPDVPVSELSEVLNDLLREFAVIPYIANRTCNEEGRLVDATSYRIVGSDLPEVETVRVDATSYTLPYIRQALAEFAKRTNVKQTFEEMIADEFSTEGYEALSEPGDQGAYLGE